MKSTIERINKVLGNLVKTYNLHETYAYDANPWIGILAAADLTVRSTYLNIILKAVTMIYPVTRWFEINQYRNKKSMTIANLVETMWLVRYPWPEEVTYDWGG